MALSSPMNAVGSGTTEERRVLLPRARSEFGISLPDPIPNVPGAKA